MSMGKKLVRGSALRIIEFFATAVIGLILMPFIIHSLGDTMYGLWIFVGTFVGYYGLFDLGLDSAVQRYISRAIGLKDNDEVNIIINTSLLVFAIIGIFALFCSFIIAIIVPLLIKNISEVNIFRKIILILGLNFSFTFPMRVFSGFLRANIRYDLTTAIALIKLIARTVLIVIFLKLGYGIIALALITFAVNIGDYFLKYILVRKLYKYVQLSKQFIMKSHIKSLFHYSLVAFVAQLANQLRFNVDNIVIVVFLGLNYVTIYSIAMRLIKYFYEFMASIIGILKPVFSQYEGRGDYKSIKKQFILTTKISSYVAIFIGGIFVVFGNAFINRWVGAKYSQAYPLLIVLLCPAVLELMQNPSIQLLYGISKHKFHALENAIEGIAIIILSIIFVKKYGLLGIALGKAIPVVFMRLFIQPVYTCKMINLSVRKYYFSIILPTMIKSSIIFGVFWFLCKKFIIPEYLNLIMLVAFVSAIFSISVFFIGFNKIEQNYFKKLVFNIGND